MLGVEFVDIILGVYDKFLEDFIVFVFGMMRKFFLDWIMFFDFLMIWLFFVFVCKVVCEKVILLSLFCYIYIFGMIGYLYVKIFN